MQTVKNLADEVAFLTGGGEMGELMRRKNWSQTKIGIPQGWPSQLKHMVATLLTVPSPMLICWGDDYTQFYNDAFRPILGHNKHPQALGIGVDETYAEVWPTLKPLFDQVTSGTPVSFEEFKLLINRNGYDEEVYFDFSYSPIKNLKNEIEGVLVICWETTNKVNALRSLVQSEERFQNLVRDSTAAIIVLTGKEMKVEIVNEAYGRLIGLTPDDLLGKPLFTMIPQAEEYYLPLLDKVRSTGEPLMLFDSPYSVVTNGKQIEGFLHVVYQPYKSAQGEILGVMAILQDVTESVKAKKALEDSQGRLEQEVDLRTRQLKQSNEDLQQFAHVASHDLKEPVRKIKTFTSRLQDEMNSKLDSKERMYLEKVQNATDRMTSMIDGVLAYSSMNATRLMPEVVDLDQIIENIKSDLEIVIQQRAAQIIYRDLPTLQGAAVLLYQLFYNLINNSIKFAKPDQPVVIELTSEIVMLDRIKNAQIKVKDNGIGFDEKFAVKIFNTFTRLNPKDKYEGTGLGLALCKKIVERHSGSIKANSSSGNGATFTISLPLKQTNTI